MGELDLEEPVASEGPQHTDNYLVAKTKKHTQAKKAVTNETVTRQTAENKPGKLHSA